jgi:hypothetical protein
LPWFIFQLSLVTEVDNTRSPSSSTHAAHDLTKLTQAAELADLLTIQPSHASVLNSSIKQVLCYGSVSGLGAVSILYVKRQLALLT